LVINNDGVLSVSDFINVNANTALGHSGNDFYTTTAGSSWSTFGTRDTLFKVTGTAPLAIDKVSNVDSGFVNTVNGVDTDPFTSGQMVSYTVQSVLNNGTYYWRVRALDPSGTNYYGQWSASRTFTIAAATTNTGAFFMFFN
jgi:hypothetical protein